MRELSVQRLVVAFLCAALAACGSAKVDLGNTKDPALLGSSLTDYAGGWVGYAEAFRWNDGTEEVRLILDDEGQGVLIVGGEDAELPKVPDPATDFTMIIPGGLAAGYEYSIVEASVTTRRIQASAKSHEVYEDFCAAFEPVADHVNPGTYSCLPNTGWSYEPSRGCTMLDRDATPVDCDKLVCWHVCTCDADGCKIMNDLPNIQLDAALESDGTELEGTLSTGAQRITIRMERTP